MDKVLAKSLVSLIDETIAEIEDLKKSKFSAAEVDMGKEESGIAKHPTNGKMGKEEDKDDDDDKDDKDMDKGENESADPGKRGVVAPSEPSVPAKSNLHAEAAKAEGDEDEDDDKDEEKKKKMKMDKGENESADPGKRGVVAPSEPSVPAKSNLHAEANKAEDGMKKSFEESEALMKSYVDEKFGGLEKKLEAVLSLVKEIGDKPVERKGVSAKTVVPLEKSNDSKTLSKSEVASKLFELKKSGTKVDSDDIAMAEIGGNLQAITEKYGLN